LTHGINTSSRTTDQIGGDLMTSSQGLVQGQLPLEASDLGSVRSWKRQILEASDLGSVRSWKRQILETSDLGSVRSWKRQILETSDLGNVRSWKCQILETSDEPLRRRTTATSGGDLTSEGPKWKELLFKAGLSSPHPW